MGPGSFVHKIQGFAKHLVNDSSTSASPGTRFQTLNLVSSVYLEHRIGGGEGEMDLAK